MNARIKIAERCDGCGMVDPLGDVALYEHDSAKLCGACLDEVLAGPVEVDDEARWLHERDHAASKL